MTFDLGTLFRLARNPDPEEIFSTVAPLVAPQVANHLVKKYLPATAIAKAGSLVDRYAGARFAFLEHLRAAPSGLYVIIGAPGTGKTSFALALAEEIGRPTYAVNMKTVPEWVQPLALTAIADLDPGSIVIVDDAGQAASSRDYTSDGARALEDLLAAYRHLDLVIIVTTTATNTVHTALLDATAFFVKPPSMFRRAAERRELAWLMDMASDAWGQIDEVRRKSYIFAVSESPVFAGFVQYDPPRGWSEAVSKNKA